MRVPSLPSAPGVQAMQKGQPWTVPGNQYPSCPRPTPPQLVPIHVLMQSTRTPAGTPPSPASTIAIPPSVTDPHASQECPKTWGSRSSTEEICDKDSSFNLKVPKEAQRAQGGFFDPDNWIFQIVWNHVRDMDLPSLLTAYFHREDRGKYGEHHTSTRGVTPINRFSDEPGRKAKGSEAHRFQERGRRIRHRYLQFEGDELISTFVLWLAQKELPKIKATIQQMDKERKSPPCSGSDAGDSQQEERLRAANGTGKKLGKDDQLTAALMSQHVAFILISRLYRGMVDAQDTVDVLTKELAQAQDTIDGLEKKLAQTQTTSHDLKEEQVKSHDCNNINNNNNDSHYWQQRFEKSEADRHSLGNEVPHLHHQLQEEKSRDKPLAQPLLPIPVNTATKRSFDSLVGRIECIYLPDDTSFDNQAKRRAFKWIRPSLTAGQLHGRAGYPYFPPSPSPSFDGSPFPGCTSPRFAVERGVRTEVTAA